jgi:hypothetical protein
LHFGSELIGGKSQVVGPVPLEEHTIKRFLLATGFGQSSRCVAESLELGRDPVTSSLVQVCTELVNQCMAVLRCSLCLDELLSAARKLVVQFGELIAQLVLLVASFSSRRLVCWNWVGLQAESTLSSR